MIGSPVPSGMGGYGDRFPDPFNDVASMNMPLGMRSALRTCERVWLASGSYRMAQQRIVSYFLTDIEFHDCHDDDREKYTEFAENFGLLDAAQQMYIDRACYGNGFATILVPFKRLLVCKQCHNEYPLKVVYNTSEFGFKWSASTCEFVATCPKCHWHGPFGVNDLPEDMEKRIRVKTWNPHEIEILHDMMTGDCAYTWRIPEDYKTQIRRGNLFHLERVSMPVLQAIKRNQVFRFHSDVLFHMREETPSGIRNRGWGIPRALTNFRQVYYVQVLKRYNEALALDYIIPFRVITPMARTGASGGQMARALDPMQTMDMGDFNSQVRSMIRRRGRDPAMWCTLPFPIQYQALGGDASQLAPSELLDQGLQQLLNDSGTPIELYNGSLTLQTAPVALRLFEATNTPLVRSGNQFLNWAVKQVSQILQWESVKTRFKRVTYADDISRQMAMLQLMTGQQVSATTGLASLGLNFQDEVKRLAEEAREKAEITDKVQQEMDEPGLSKAMIAGPQAGGQPGAPGQPGAAQAQGAPAGGQPAGMGPAPLPGQSDAMQPATSYLQSKPPGSQIDVESFQQSANQLVSALATLPHETRQKQLRELREGDPTMHGLVTAGLQKQRRQQNSQPPPDQSQPPAG